VIQQIVSGLSLLHVSKALRLPTTNVLLRMHKSMLLHQSENSCMFRSYPK
jgi:hypothetical protein